MEGASGNPQLLQQCTSWSIYSKLQTQNTGLSVVGKLLCPVHCALYPCAGTSSSEMLVVVLPFSLVLCNCCSVASILLVICDVPWLFVLITRWLFV